MIIAMIIVSHTTLKKPNLLYTGSIQSERESISLFSI